MTSPTRSASAARPWRIVFMGTPEFAVPCLQALLDGPDPVVAVVAQPDRPSGRGNKLQSPPTIQLARAHGIPTLQAEKVRVPAFRDALAAFEPDVMVVVAYGRILTEAVLAVPPQGCINVHASLLPKYRGAAPIQWSVLRGETLTGVTTMKMDVGLDTGDMLLTRTLEIGPEQTAGELHDALAPVGAQLLLETIAQLKAGTLQPTPQEHAAATHAPMLKKEDGQLDWRRPARELDWHVRGMTPWPSAYTFLESGARLTVLKGRVLEGRVLEGRVLEGRVLEGVTEIPAGQVVSVGPEGLCVATGAGLYRIEVLKPENGKAMPVGAWLNGHPVAVGTRLGRVLDPSNPATEHQPRTLS